MYMLLCLFGILFTCFGLVGLLIAALTRGPIRRTLERCTAETTGTHQGEAEVARLNAGIVGGSNVSSYAAVVEYGVDGVTYKAPARYSEGLGTFTKAGTPVEVHYDPRDPGFCWARLPGTSRSLARSLPTVMRVCAVLVVLGVPMAVVGFVCV